MFYYKIHLCNGLCHYRKSKKAIRNLKDMQELNGSNGIAEHFEGIGILRYLLRF